MARRLSAIVGTALFLVVAPGVVAGLAPWAITHWRVRPPWLGLAAIRYLGGALIALGAAGLLESFARFALQGLGTPAPVFPTRKLVVGGLYRHVRNPMYLAVAAIIFGQALLFASAPLLAYGGLVWLLCHAFVIVYEEPKLRAAFATDYADYCAAVPRWIPRVRPWRG